MAEFTQNRLDANSEYLYEMLARIQQRPGMYLGQCSITRLRSFLDGYIGAREDLGIALTEQEKNLGRFQDWIQERFKITSTQGWDSIILFYSADERDALDLFFQLFEQFRYSINTSRSQFTTDNSAESTPLFTQNEAIV
jgi:hypothetical protein